MILVPSSKQINFLLKDLPDSGHNFESKSHKTLGVETSFLFLVDYKIIT